MEWIKAIIEKHTKEDGTVDMDAVMKEINQEFPKNAVPKENYNNISNQLKTANDTLKDLQEKTKDNPDIQKQLKEAQDAREKAEKDLGKLQTDVQLKEKLREAGAKDIDYMIFKLGDLEKNKDGSIKDIDNKIKSLKESAPSHFEKEKDDKDNKEDNKPAGFQVKDNKLDKGKTQKTYTQDQLKSLSAEEINENWEAVSAALQQGGNE